MGALVDLTGQTFGRLLVLKRMGSNYRGSALWWCLCDCLRTSTVDGADLRKGTTNSCGCLLAESVKERGEFKIDNLVGQEFGNLVVKGMVRYSNSGVKWVCVCKCGNSTTVRASNLKAGSVQSCGCLRRDHCKTMSYKHGHHKSAEYQSWRSMLKRCLNPKTAGYRYWGGRGISVCDRWMIFENFLFDMGPRPPGTTLDRIDVEGNYEPGNCRWATLHEQIRNRRPKFFASEWEKAKIHAETGL